MRKLDAVFAFLAVLIATALLCNCGSASSSGTSVASRQPAEPAESSSLAPPLAVTSDAFISGDPIPVKYTCDGDDVSPPLSWGNVPQNAESLVLIVDDPDAPAGTWIHWVLFDVPADTNSLQEGLSADVEPNDGGVQGVNSWKRRGYGGPCPPNGSHHYFFKLYALDAMLELGAEASKQDVLTAMEGHILTQGELMGTYARQ